MACALPAWAAACSNSRGRSSAAAGALGWFRPRHTQGWSAFAQRRQRPGRVPVQVFGQTRGGAGQRHRPAADGGWVGAGDAATDLAPRQACGCQGWPSAWARSKPVPGLGGVGAMPTPCSASNPSCHAAVAALEAGAGGTAGLPAGRCGGFCWRRPVHRRAAVRRLGLRGSTQPAQQLRPVCVAARLSACRGFLSGTLQRDVGWFCHGGNACMGQGHIPELPAPTGPAPTGRSRWAGGPGEPYRRDGHWRGRFGCRRAGCGAAN